MKIKLIFFSLLTFFIGKMNAQNDFDIVKQRVVSEILKTSANDSIVSQLVATVEADGTWPDINYKDVSKVGFEHSIHLKNLVNMSLTFNTKSSKFYHDKKLKRLINKSLKLWCDNDYMSENWWFNQISTPNSLVTVLLLMDGHINKALKIKSTQIIDRANLNAPGARQGGDRIKIGGIAAKNKLVIGDEEQFSQIMKVINDEIKFTTGDRGMQHDYSFHHRVDRVNTTYSYGTNYAVIFSEWAAFVKGTKYSFSEVKLEHLIDYYLDGVCKQLVYGKYIDKGTMNRGVTRKENFAPQGTVSPEKLLTATNYRKEELEEIINLRKELIEPTSSFSKFFWQTEHFVYQRPNFYTSIRLYSVRNRNMEEPYNSEGLFNHYKADGANFLSLKGDEYLNIWPVFDWQKIPGTTVLQKPNISSEENIQKDGLTDFVGAATDGQYGAVAFDFISPHDFIKARKAWFFFDEEYVCLGAGIESNSEFPVVTTLNQTLLKGDVLVSNGENQTKLAMDTHYMEDVNWAYHNGVGYIFPKSAKIHISNTKESGSWYAINKQWSSSKEIISKDVFKLWFNHGARPQGRQGGLNNEPMLAKDVTYEYIVVPSTNVQSLDSSRGIEIISNNKYIQAVKNNKLGISQIVFYKAGEIVISKDLSISIDSPGVILVKIEHNIIKEITVADPSRKLSKIHLEISGKIDERNDTVLNAVFNNKKNTSKLTIALPQGFYAGQSISIKL